MVTSDLILIVATRQLNRLGVVRVIEYDSRVIGTLHSENGQVRICNWD